MLFRFSAVFLINAVFDCYVAENGTYNVNRVIEYGQERICNIEGMLSLYLSPAPVIWHGSLKIDIYMLCGQNQHLYIIHTSQSHCRRGVMRYGTMEFQYQIAAKGCFI